MSIIKAKERMSINVALIHKYVDYIKLRAIQNSGRLDFKAKERLEEIKKCAKELEEDMKQLKIHIKIE